MHIRRLHRSTLINSLLVEIDLEMSIENCYIRHVQSRSIQIDRRLQDFSLGNS